MEMETKTEAETETETERSGSGKVDKNKIWEAKNSMWCSKVIQAAAQHVQCSIKQVFSSHLNYLQGKRVVILQTTKESFNSFHLDDDSKFTLLTRSAGKQSRGQAILSGRRQANKAAQKHVSLVASRLMSLGCYLRYLIGE